MANKVYTGDVGTLLTLNVKENIEAATVTKIKVKKPNKTEVIWDASIYDKNKIQYIIQEGDLDIAGEYFVQAYIESPVWKGSGETASFIVYDKYK